jgi:hypothetical protein
MKPKRPPIPRPIQRSIQTKNLGVCCVCKERGIGTNLHHIDGNPTNNIEDNIAVLCLKEHDQHHRPNAYDKTKHLELGADKILEFKREWEQTVVECKTDNPKILATLNIFGTEERVDSVRLVFQNINSKIIYQRDFYLLIGPPDQWIDNILEEVCWLSKKIKLSVINKPLEFEYCGCGSGALSTTIDRNAAIYVTANDWKEKSIVSIYINPTFPSIAFTLFYGNELLYTANLHKCTDGYFHFITDKFEERTPIKKKPSISTQAREIVQRVADTWTPGRIFIGTGNPDDPTITNEFNLPDIWEKKNNR